MKKLQSGSTLADWFCENEFEGITKDELKEIEEAKVFGDMPLHTIGKATVFGEPVVIVYQNDGQFPTYMETEWSEISLDDIEFWRDVTVGGKSLDPEEEVVFTQDGKEFEACFDDEAITRSFFPSGSGWGKFVGVYKFI
ncbi:hypothetical protein H8E77_27810 [bacterium]|nr:hypothetical protein [bacterium]